MIEFIDVVNVIKGETYDEWGVLVSNKTIENVPCRIMYTLKNEELKIAKGETVIPKANIYFEGLMHISLDDKVNFMDDFGEEHTVEVLDVKPIKDFSGEILYTRVVI